jgi:hypothetical protein
MKTTTAYFPACKFSYRRAASRTERPLFRFSDSLYRREELPRDEAARLIRSARRITRES